VVIRYSPEILTGLKIHLLYLLGIQTGIDTDRFDTDKIQIKSDYRYRKADIAQHTVHSV
jgi:hypothetical protein